MLDVGDGSTPYVAMDDAKWSGHSNAANRPGMRCWDEGTAVTHIQEVWRDHRINMRVKALKRIHAERDEKRRLLAIEQEIDDDRKKDHNRLHGAGRYNLPARH